MQDGRYEGCDHTDCTCFGANTHELMSERTVVDRPQSGTQPMVDGDITISRKHTEVLEYDYEAQVWLVDGIIQPCGHTDDHHKHHMCVAHTWQGFRIEDLRKFFSPA